MKTIGKMTLLGKNPDGVRGEELGKRRTAGKNRDDHVYRAHLIRLGTACRAGAFAVFVALAVLWARSYWRVDVADVFWWSAERKTYIQTGAATDRGVLAVVRSDWGNLGPYGRFRDGRPPVRFCRISSPVREPGSGGYIEPGWGDCWFKFQRLARGDGVTGDWERDIPLWTIEAVLLGVWLPAALRWRRRRWRARRGLCRMCGYDLRASPGQYPECGWRAARKAASKTPTAPE